MYSSLVIHQWLVKGFTDSNAHSSERDSKVMVPRQKDKIKNSMLTF